jgi:hypothetical protein
VSKRLRRELLETGPSHRLTLQFASFKSLKMATGTPIKSPASPEVAYSNVWNGHPRKFKNVLFQVTTFILMMELAERVSYFGIGQGLKNFMQKIGWSLVSASALKSTWSSICFLSPLLGAYLADEVWGRFRTILTMGIWYCVGDFSGRVAFRSSVATLDRSSTPKATTSSTAAATNP